jgi:hypothetical protein
MGILMDRQPLKHDRITPLSRCGTLQPAWNRALGYDTPHPQSEINTHQLITRELCIPPHDETQ